MSDRARTKEERYILKMYEMSLALGNPSQTLDRYAIGAALGLSYRVVNAMCNTLLQANFLKKEDEFAISLTVRGIDLAKRLLAE